MRALVIGSGAGGAMAAKQLQASGAEVTVVEAGKQFRPLTRKVLHAGALRRTGLLGGERTISLLFPHLRTARSGELVTVRGMGAGGCTTLSCGNWVRTDNGLGEIGLDLSPEFEDIGRMVPATTMPRERWRPATAEMFDAASDLGMRPEPTPKAVDIDRCTGCGMCELGCASGARWDSRRWIDEAIASGASVHYGHKALEVLVEGGRAVGVVVASPSGIRKIRADQIVFAAGGLGTAQVLRRSGIEISDTLWIDPVITFGGVRRDSRQLDEIPMAWYARGPSCIISPYVDLLSHFFHPSWRNTGIRDRVGVMVKLADEANGRVDEDGNFFKTLSPEDDENIAEAARLVNGIMTDAGVQGPLAMGMVNGGHLGGTVPLRPEDVDSMRPGHLPENLWIADLSLVPKSQGMPTMMLAAAMALRVSRTIAERQRRG